VLLQNDNALPLILGGCCPTILDHLLQLRLKPVVLLLKSRYYEDSSERRVLHYHEAHRTHMKDALSNQRFDSDWHYQQAHYAEE
jgi:hypothetical protein